MPKPRSAVWLLALGLMVAGGTFAQDFPSKPVRIVTSAAGGGNDFNARLVAQGLASDWGQPVIVDNRPDIVSADIVAKAPPDGYTLLIDGGSFWIGPLMQKTPYDPVADFSPITLITMNPSVLVVYPAVPANSVKELIALAKAKPGALNYGTSGTGSSTHLAAELFKSMSGINIVRINYRGAGPAITGLIGGEIQLMFGSLGSTTAHIKAGRLRALAVTTPQPSVLLPGLPAVAATLPGYESVSRAAIFAPAKTPQSIVNRLNQESIKVLNTPAVREKFISAGIEPVSSTPGELAAVIQSDLTKLGKLIKDAGIKAD